MQGDTKPCLTMAQKYVLVCWVVGMVRASDCVDCVPVSESQKPQSQCTEFSDNRTCMTPVRHPQAGEQRTHGARQVSWTAIRRFRCKFWCFPWMMVVGCDAGF